MTEQGLVDSCERLQWSLLYNLMQLRYIKRQKNIQRHIPQHKKYHCWEQAWRAAHGGDGARGDCRGHAKITQAFPSAAAGGHSKQKAVAFCNTKHSWTLTVVSVEFCSALSPVCSSVSGCPWHCCVLRWWLSCRVESSQPDCEAGQVSPPSSHPGNVCSSRESTFLSALQLLIDRPGRKCNL